MYKTISLTGERHIKVTTKYNLVKNFTLGGGV